MSRQVRASAPDPAQWAAMQEATMAAPLLAQKQAAAGEIPPSSLHAAALPTGATPQAAPKDAAAKAQPLALMTERQQLAFLMRATSEGDDDTARRKKRRQQQQDMEDDEEEDSSEDDDDTPLQQGETGAATMSDDSENEAASSSSTESSSDSSEEDEEPTAPAAVVITATASSSAAHSHSKPSRATPNTDHLPQPVRRPLEYTLWDSARRKAWDGMRTDPNKFYYSYLPPGVTAPQSSTGGEAPWTPREKSLFMYSLEGYPPEGQWGLFSLNIPGRTGRECEAFFKALHKEGLVSGGGVATAASARKPPVNQPVKFSAAAAIEYKLETTPIVVARAMPIPGLGAGAASAREHKEKRARELETAIALMSLLPMPGTIGLKPYTGRESSSASGSSVKTPATPQTASRKKQAQQGQTSGEERSAEENKENRGGQRHSAPSARASVSSSAQSSRARATPSTPAAGATPNASKGSSHKHASGSGADKSGRSWPASASTTESSSSGQDPKQQQRVRAASDALMACMSDIAASTSASRSAAAASSASSQEGASAEDLVPVVGSKRKPTSASGDADEAAATVETRVPRKRAYTDAAASAGGSGSGSGAGRASSGSGSRAGGSGSRELRDLLGSSSSPAIAPLYPPHLVGRQVLCTASPQTAPANSAPTETRVSSTPILPFSSFSIPAHTPYSGFSRRAALAHSDSLLRAYRPAQPQAAALTPFAPPFFDPFRMAVQEEVPHIDNNTGNLTMRDAVTGENTCAAAFAAAGAGGSGSTEDDDGDSTTGSFAAELAKLDATYRLRLKRLASHQAQQFARIKRHYGVPEDSASAAGVAAGSHPHHYIKAAATGLPESGPFGSSTHSFAKGCRRTLEEFFNKEMEQEAVPSLVSRCRTYGDAVHEINNSYKNLLKELQREHATGRDVLISLKTTGLLR